MNWLDVLTDWGFGIVVIRALFTFFIAFVVGYCVGTSQGYLQGIKDGAGVRTGVRKSAKSATTRPIREQNAQKPEKIRI